MKKIILLLCFLCFTAPPVLAGDDFSKTGQLYRNKEHYFSVTLPKGWSIEPGKNPHVAMKSRDSTKVLSFSVTVVKYKSNNKTIDKYIFSDVAKEFTFSDVAEEYHSLGLKPDIIESGKGKLCNGNALWGYYTLATKDVFTVNYQIITFRANRMYSLNFATGGAVKDIDVVLASFKFAEQGFFTDILKSFSFESWVKYDF